MTPTDWANAMGAAYVAASIGDFDRALEFYREADMIAESHDEMRGAACNPQLSLLRHRRGKADGFVRALPPSEDVVLGMEFAVRIPEFPIAMGLRDSGFSTSADAIVDVMDHVATSPDFDHHRDNIREHLPHIQVLSTGRCGTVSLHRLLEKVGHMPYHQCLLNVSRADIQEAASSLLAGERGDDVVWDAWAKTRAAEWLGAINIGTPAAFVSHRDTVFAPVIAALHPQARFIHLYRDPDDVFLSYYRKQQWSEAQVRPTMCSFDNGFNYRFVRPDIPREIAWFIRWTDEFVKKFEHALCDPERVIHIDASRLWAGDQVIIESLAEFIGCDDIGMMTGHFKIPYNQKLHKVSVADDVIAAPLAAFSKAMGEMI